VGLGSRRTTSKHRSSPSPRALEAAAKRLSPLLEIESLKEVVDPPPLAAGGQNAFMAPLRSRGAKRERR